MDDIAALAAAVVSVATASGLTIATAESCTGGLLAAALTGVPGSSVVFDRGFLTYSNAAKAQMLGIDPDLIAAHGAVSCEVALAMATGALAAAPVDIAVSITGIAGPGGGSSQKPVGLVHLACARRGFEPRHREERFADRGREGVRQASVGAALSLVLELAALSGGQATGADVPVGLAPPAP